MLFWPAPRVTVQPPTLEYSNDCGKWPQVYCRLAPKSSGALWSVFFQIGPDIPACTVMVWSISLKLMTLLKLRRISSEMPPLTGSTPRVTLLPPP